MTIEKKVSWETGNKLPISRFFSYIELIGLSAKGGAVEKIKSFYIYINVEISMFI